MRFTAASLSMDPFEVSRWRLRRTRQYVFSTAFWYWNEVCRLL
jgi:hypothetical protein